MIQGTYSKADWCRERMFAKPFLGQLGNGHVQGIYSMCKDKNSLSSVASGSGDGIVKVWDLTTREEAWRAAAHSNVVKGMTFTNDKKLLTCATDGIKLWDPYNTSSDTTPLATWQEGGPYTSLSFHRTGNVFGASSGAGCIRVWDLEHSTAAQTIQWPNFTDTITDVCFNQVETSVIGSVASDRSVILFDLRTNSMSPPIGWVEPRLTAIPSACHQNGAPVRGQPHCIQPDGSHEPGCSV